jgi:O-antigen/teichoic acid export membrane protein
MTNKEQQIKNSFIYLLPMVIGCILPFITLPIFTRILTKEDYGVLALAQVYAIFVSGLANFGMTAAYDRNYFQYRGDLEESAQLLYSIVLFVVVNFLVLAVLTYLFRRTLAEFIIGSAEHEKILFWAFCFKNSEIAKDFVKYTIVAAFINLIISLFLVAYLRIGVIGLIYAQLCSGFTVFCLLTYRFVEYLPPSLSKSKLKEALQIAYPLTPRIFLGIINTQFDKYMIGLLASVGGVGIYSIGQRISYIIFTYMTAIQNVFTPQVYKRMFDLDERGGESIGKYLTPFAYVCIFPALLLFFQKSLSRY